MAVYTAIFFRRDDDPALHELYADFRRRLFVDRLGWDLPVRDGLELDGFDRPDTTYAVLLKRGKLLGGFRLLRTDTPYLGESVFPQLALDRPYPRDADGFEVTRFGIDPDVTEAQDGTRLYALMFWFARSRNVRSLVAVCDEAYERFLRGMGVRTRRFGPPVRIGHDRFGRPLDILAGEIPLALQSGSRFARLLALADDMEILDETSLLGRRRLSA